MWSTLRKRSFASFRQVDMFKFSQMTIDVDSQIAEIAETIQVVDLRNLQDSFGEGSATVGCRCSFQSGSRSGQR